MAIKFKESWTEADTKLAKKKIVGMFHKNAYQSKKLNRKFSAATFYQIEQQLGVAYTSSSSYAGLWICNDEIFLDGDIKLISFAISEDNIICSVWWDSEEKETIIPIDDLIEHDLNFIIHHYIKSVIF